jgi:hypothetical protein
MDIFYNLVDFGLEIEKEIQTHLLTKGKTRKNRPFSMADSEVITIMTYLHFGSFRNFEHFYLYYVKTHFQSEFPKAVSYNRFVELMQKAMLPMTLYLKMTFMGECTGISFVDSTTLKVCNNRRTHNHKVFKSIAESGKGSMGWFYGFKLHLIVNDKGEIISFLITQGNVDDRDPLLDSKLRSQVKGKLFGDRGYIFLKNSLKCFL